MLNVLQTVECGGFQFDAILPNLVHLVVLAIQIFIPIALILLGMLDMGKAVMGNDEKAMKEQQGKLIKRVVYAIVIFLIVAIVRTVFGILGNATDSETNATSCITCFVEGADKCTKVVESE